MQWNKTFPFQVPFLIHGDSSTIIQKYKYAYKNILQEINHKGSGSADFFHQNADTTPIFCVWLKMAGSKKAFGGCLRFWCLRGALGTRAGPGSFYIMP